MTEVLTREKKAAWTAWRSAYKSGTGRKILRQASKILLGAAPGFALAFSDICGVSAGAWAAYGMAAASCGMMSYPVSLGIAAAFLMRMLWGLTTRWELLIGAVLVLLSPHVLRQKNGAFPLIATGLALLPGAIIGVWQGSAATLLFGIGTILLGTLSAPVMRRAIESIRGGRSFETLESRLSVGYLLLMLLCAALGLGAAQAEVYRVENEANVPADWAEKDTLRLTCIDTNRSDAMVLQSGGEAMMVDSGEGRYRRRVYATLDGYGITELKYLLNTHCDDDHLHGFIYLMYSDLYQVDAFLSPNTTTYVDEEGYHQQAVKATGTKNIPYVQIGDGDELTLGNAKLTIFRCPLPTGQNNRSAACMVQFGDSRAFLTGDIDNETMQWYAATYGEKLHCDILKALHHGLATIPDSFVEQTQPQVLFVPNRSALSTKVTAGWVKNHMPGAALYFSGDGTVTMLTDGTDWYIWQEPNYVDPQ